MMRALIWRTSSSRKATANAKEQKSAKMNKTRRVSAYSQRSELFCRSVISYKTISSDTIFGLVLCTYSRDTQDG